MRLSSSTESSGRELERHCRLSSESHAFLGEAATALRLSARAYTRILRIARTIADLEKDGTVATRHLAEAINCRALDRMKE
jgi:magnesium chelatase family protein